MDRAQPVRPCIYCSSTGADVCVRIVEVGPGSSRPEFAHRGCAERRNVRPLYTVLAPGTSEAQR